MNIYVDGYEFTIVMCLRMFVYAYVHIGMETYLCEWLYEFYAGTTNPILV